MNEEQFRRWRVYPVGIARVCVCVCVGFVMTATLYVPPYGKGLNMRKAESTRHAHMGTDNGKTTKRNYRAVLLRG